MNSPRVALLLVNCARALLVMSLSVAPANAAPPTAPATAHTAAAPGASDRGTNWESFGGTAAEDHYSPLTDINDATIKRLRLAWWLDLPAGNSVSAPLEVDGTLYVATGYSILRALVASTGKVLWIYDPKAPEAAGHKLRQGWGIRGLAYAHGKLYVGTHDGRLLAVDAATGKLLWSVLTVDPDDVRFISGAPRAFDDKVVIGHGGADVGSIRGYVDCYDGGTGKRLWRFYTVPGNPADGFENKAMEMAAKTWFGEWWKYGGGGTVWNSMTYDPEFHVFYLGVGNGAPWNRKIRSAGQGDNLFLASVVAVDADTGAYKWHYQENPGESWDYNASMDLELATLSIDGRPRKVLLTAPKNGFFYVIDRTDGKLVSAQPFAKVTWASKIDIATGRPVELPNIRYENGETTIWPGPVGAHSWQPMSFNPKTGLVYLPTIELPAGYNDKGIDPKTWQRIPGNAVDNGVVPSFTPNLPGAGTSYLQAWDPVQQHSVWKVSTPSFWNGGTLTTGGNLVFQGQIDGKFNAYAADTGKLLWSYAAGAAVIAPPVSYGVAGQQYVTVLSGNDTSGSAFGLLYQQYGIGYRTQKWRVLTFVLDGTASLPANPPPPQFVPAADPGFRADAAATARGMTTYNLHCAVCHGVGVVGGGHAPDLRASAIPPVEASFDAVVRGGALVANGMPRFEEFSDGKLEDLREFIRSQAHGGTAP
jgi:quinohemoprotein ethanol dehydrogenase